MRKPINKVSKKQAVLNAIWKRLFWQAIDEQHALKGYTYCEMCGQSKLVGDLQPHHKVRRSQGGEYTKENMMLVDNECHNKLTFGGKE